MSSIMIQHHFAKSWARLFQRFYWSCRWNGQISSLRGQICLLRKFHWCSDTATAAIFIKHFGNTITPRQENMNETFWFYLKRVQIYKWVGSKYLWGENILLPSFEYNAKINRFFSTIARLCTVLGCKVSDLIIYEPPKSWKKVEHRSHLVLFSIQKKNRKNHLLFLVSLHSLLSSRLVTTFSVTLPAF